VKTVIQLYIYLVFRTGPAGPARRDSDTRRGGRRQLQVGAAWRRAEDRPASEPRVARLARSDWQVPRAWSATTATLRPGLCGTAKSSWILTIPQWENPFHTGRKSKFFSGFARKFIYSKKRYGGGGGAKNGCLQRSPRFVSETMRKSANN
jgi:hypothetical protein